MLDDWGKIPIKITAKSTKLWMIQKISEHRKKHQKSSSI